MSEIWVKSFSETDIDEFMNLSFSEYGESTLTNPQHVKWKHIDSPFGASTYVNFKEGNKIAGRSLIQPRDLRTVSGTISAGSVMDLLIDAEFRSTPINFINMIKASDHINDFDLIYHTSNERSEPLYNTLLRFPKPFSMQAYGFPLRLSGFLSSIIGRKIAIVDWLIAPLRWLLVSIFFIINLIARLDISQQNISDDELESLCENSLKVGPIFARTNAFLKWRFIDAPLWSGIVHRIDQSGQFIGYLVTRQVELNGLTYLVLLDFLVTPKLSFLSRAALRFWLIQYSVKSKTDAFFTMINSFGIIARKCIGFPLLKIPEKLLPHATPIFIRPNSNDFEEFKTTTSIHMTLVDIDYF